MSKSDRLHVKKGDSFGFTWLNGGCLKYDVLSETGHYCSNPVAAGVVPHVGDEVTLQLGAASAREYSIKLFYQCGETKEGKYLDKNTMNTLIYQCMYQYQ